VKSNTRLFVVGGLLVALALALLVSPFASSSPDGLQAVAEKQGFADSARASKVDTPLAGYAVSGVDQPRVSSGLSGVIGVLLTFGLGFGLFAALRTFRPDGQQPESPEV